MSEVRPTSGDLRADTGRAAVPGSRPFFAAAGVAALLGFLYIHDASPAPKHYAAGVNEPSLRPGGTPRTGGLLVLAGSLHDHSTDSDGNATSDDVVAWEYAHRQELGIDFAGLSEHADFLPFAYLAPQDGNAWEHQASLEARYAKRGFAFVRAFEYTSDQENHLGVIGSSGFITGSTKSDTSMRPFYDWLLRAMA